jgi:guanylate kinase
MPSCLTVLAGPSGVGKGTVVARLRELYPHLWVSVSCTTRRPRPGETEGVQYRFVTRPQFHELVRTGQLLEWAEFAGNLYGTPRAPVEQKLAAGEPALLELDINGARQVRAALPDAQLVFLAPPSWDELQRRLTGRGTEAPDGVAERLDQARIEMAAAEEFDRVIVNHDVAQAAHRLAELMGVEARA